MAFTKVAAAGISSSGSFILQNINSTGVITATSIVATTGNFSGNVTIGGTLTYEDVTNIDSIGVVTARNGVNVLSGGINAVGVITASGGFSGNVNSTGVSTFTTLRVGTAVTISGGIVTATSFRGDGSFLTGIAATTNVITNSLIVSGVSTFAAGSVTAPSISPTGDNNTGIFFPAADTVSIAEGGVEALRVNDRGQILLGVSGFAAATSPTASYTQYTPLHLIGGTGTNNGSSIFIARNQTAASSSNQDLGSVIWGTNDGAPFARIASFVDGNSSGSSYPGYITFQTTASGATTPTERMRVDSAGRILGNNTSIFASGRLATTTFASGTVNLYLYTGSQPSGTGSYNFYQQLPAGTQGGIYEVAAFGGPEYAGVGPGSALIYALFSVNYNGVFSTITSNVRINPDPANPAFMNASWNTSTNFVFASWGNQGYQNYPMMYFRRLGAYL